MGRSRGDQQMLSETADGTTVVSDGRAIAPLLHHLAYIHISVLI